MNERQLAASPGSRRKQSHALKDEVYRHMFRLEAHHPGAALDLAIALLRASMAADSERKADVDRQWLRKICPICLSMIESAVRPNESAMPVAGDLIH